MIRVSTICHVMASFYVSHKVVKLACSNFIGLGVLIFMVNTIISTLLIYIPVLPLLTLYKTNKAFQCYADFLYLL